MDLKQDSLKVISQKENLPVSDTVTDVSLKILGAEKDMTREGGCYVGTRQCSVHLTVAISSICHLTNF